jgi:hypothetical protein
MELFDLPTEIFHLILQKTVSICSVKKIGELMTVCTAFRSEIPNAIAADQQFVRYHSSSNRHVSKRLAPLPTNRVALYLFSRVVSPTAKNSILRDVMKDILDIILERSRTHDQALRNQYTRILCQVMAAGLSTANAFEYLKSPEEFRSTNMNEIVDPLVVPANQWPCANNVSNSSFRRLPSKYDNALAAAIILDLDSVVKKLMEEGLCSGNGDSIFEAGGCYSFWVKEKR